MNYTLPQLLKAVVDQNASDLHLSVGSPPRLRINGKLYPLELPPLTDADAQSLLYSALTEEQRKLVEVNRELDLAISVTDLARFRVNIYHQRGQLSAAFRLIPQKIRTLKELNLPPIMQQLAMLPRGLVLVTGPTGSGKSTTLAAMVDHINQSCQNHIVTIEDPVEFVHMHKQSLVDQREVGSDTHSFARALKSVLRQDPDVVMVGELRDLETISLAISAAETGHLVLATLHTNSCVSTLNRIIDVFPSHQQDQVRTQLAMTLVGVTSQLIIPSKTHGRVMAMEIMVPNAAIRNLIREAKVHQIYSSMQTGQDASGMQTMNQALANLVAGRKLDIEAAMSKSQDVEELEHMLAKIDSQQMGPRKLPMASGGGFTPPTGKK